MSSRRAFDPIATVEAAYDTNPDFESWARGVVESTVPYLDAGLGVVGFTVRASEPGSIIEVGAGALSDDMLQVVHQMTRNVGPAHSLLFRPLVGTVSALLPGFKADAGPEDFNEVRTKWWDPFGVRDSLGVIAQADSDLLFVITAPLPRILKLTHERKRQLECCATHIGAALRLRRVPAQEHAVVRPDGVVEHAVGLAKEKRALEALRRRAIEIDRARTKLRRRDPDEALSLWKGLLEGEWSLVERFERDGRRYYIACENPVDGQGPRSLTRRERQVVELVSRGHTNKLAAYTLGVSESAISLHLSRALKKLGLRTRIELVQVAGKGE